MIIFLSIILLGFYYEWALGLLDWVPEKINNKFNNSSSIYFYNIFNFVILLQYIEIEFLIFCLFITIFLLLNQIDNLIYRVINLASLSLAVISTWIYFTDLIFLYIVYILAFIGAVIMLFLSIVLMLPSSTININNKINSLFLVIIIEMSDTFISQYYIKIFTIFIFIFCIIYLLFIIFNILIKNSSIILDFFKENATIFYHEVNSINSYLKFKFILNLWYRRTVNVLTTIFGIGISGDVFAAYTRSYENLLAAPPTVIIGLFMHDCLYFIYFHIESHLYGPITKDMYKNTEPVWGKVFKIFEYPHSPARSIKFIHFPIPDLKKPYIPIELNWSLFSWFFVVINIPFIKYIHGNTFGCIFINRFIFVINCINFFIINISYNLMYRILIHLEIIGKELILQSLVLSLFFLLTIPIFITFQIPTLELINITPVHLNISSILSIKHILYEENLLYLLSSAIALLIALIGSAIFTRNFK